MPKEKDDLTRVDGQPLTAHRDLPHRPTEDVPPTAPEKAKHTPGPWLVDGALIYALHQYKGKQVNCFSAYVEGWPQQGGTREEFEANIRLIAAAPELLQACKHALYFMDIGACGDECEPIRAAIAKAQA